MRDLHLRHTDLPAALLNLFDRSIECWDRNRIDRARMLTLPRTSEAAIDSRRLVVASPDSPIFGWSALERLELPAKDIFIERLDFFRGIRVNFEMYYALHIHILSSEFVCLL